MSTPNTHRTKYAALTPDDIRQIRNDIMPARFFSLLAFGILAVASIILYIQYGDRSALALTGLAAATLLLTWFVYWILSHKHIRDIKFGRKYAETVRVGQKYSRSVFNPDKNSGPMPKLTNLVATMGEGTREGHELYFLVINDRMYSIAKHIFDGVDVNDEIEMFYTESGRNFLGFKLIGQN